MSGSTCSNCGTPFPASLGASTDLYQCRRCSELVNSLLAEWESGRAQVEDLCRDYPKLRAELEARVAALRSFGRWLTDDQPTDEAGDDPALPELPGFALLEELGRGGMGVVYKAVQTSLNRTVALKMVLADGMLTPARRARFRVEATASARLQHPQIVQVFHVGEHENKPYLVMEYIEGGSLYDRLRDRPLAPAAAARLVELLARGVQHAHERGVIHRDLKPQNVLIDPDDMPRIVDFGLAKQADSGEHLTQTGQVMGTPCYMPPEQAAGQEVGPSADVYSLGAILYQCLVGRPPFQGPNPFEIVSQLRTHDPVAPRRLQPGIPGDLETICLKCLQKSPSRRYDSAVSLADDLQRFREGRPIRARPVGPAERMLVWVRRNPVAASLGGAVVLCVAAVVAGLWYRDQAAAAAELASKNQRLAAISAELASTEEYFKKLFQVREQATSRPEGWSWANLELLHDLATHPRRDEVELRGLLLQAANEFDLRPVAEFSDFDPTRLAFSADGRQLAIAQRSNGFVCNIHVHDVDSRRPVARVSFSTTNTAMRLTMMRLAENKITGGPIDRPTAMTFSPDGRWLVVGTLRGQVIRWDLSADRPEPVIEQAFLARTVDEIDARKEWIRQVFFSPDGSELFSTAPRMPGMKCWDVADGWREKTDVPFGSARVAALSPDGRWMAFMDEAHHLLDRHSSVTHWLQGHPRWFAECFAPDDRTLFVLNAEENALSRVHLITGNEFLVQRDAINRATTGDELAITADQSLLITSGHDTVRFWDPVSNRPPRSLEVTSAARRGETAVVSPDGRHLAVTGRGKATLYELRAGDLCRPSGFETDVVRAMDISPDGRWLATSTGHTAWVWDLDAGRAVRQVKAMPCNAGAGLHFPESTAPQDVCWHPDGDTLAWGSPWTGPVLISREAGLRGVLPTAGVIDLDDNNTRGIRDTIVIPESEFRPAGDEPLEFGDDPRAGNGRALRLLPGTDGASLPLADLAEKVKPGEYLFGVILRLDRVGDNSGGLAFEAEFGSEGPDPIHCTNDLRYIPDADYHFHVLGRWTGEELRERGGERLLIRGPAIPDRIHEIWIDAVCLVPINKQNHARRSVPMGFSPDGRTLWSASRHHLIGWNPHDRTMTELHDDRIATMITGGGTSELCSLVVGTGVQILGNTNGNLILHTAGSETSTKLLIDDGHVTALALLGDEEHLAVGLDQGELVVMRVSDGERIAEMRPHRQTLTAMAYCPALRLLVTGSRERSIRFWRWRDGELEELMRINDLPAAVSRIRMDAGARRMAVLLQDEYAVRVWDLESARELLAGAGLDPWANESAGP